MIEFIIFGATLAMVLWIPASVYCVNSMFYYERDKRAAPKSEEKLKLDQKESKA